MTRKIKDRCNRGHDLTIPDNFKVRHSRGGCKECLVCERARIAEFKQRNPLYDTWKTMIRRCSDPKFKDWHLYGGKNPPIKVCDRWMTLNNFIIDMYPRPKGHTLERKNSNGDYEKDNCKWATSKEQGRNTRRNHYIEIEGRRLTIAEWAEIAGIKYFTLFMRIKRGEPHTMRILR
jgi:hypothetical protein